MGCEGKERRAQEGASGERRQGSLLPHPQSQMSARSVTRVRTPSPTPPARSRRHRIHSHAPRCDETAASGAADTPLSFHSLLAYCTCACAMCVCVDVVSCAHSASLPVRPRRSRSTAEREGTEQQRASNEGEQTEPKHTTNKATHERSKPTAVPPRLVHDGCACRLQPHSSSPTRIRSTLDPACSEATRTPFTRNTTQGTLDLIDELQRH